MTGAVKLNAPNCYDEAAERKAKSRSMCSKADAILAIALSGNPWRLAT